MSKGQQQIYLAISINKNKNNIKPKNKKKDDQIFHPTKTNQANYKYQKETWHPFLMEIVLEVVQSHIHKTKAPSSYHTSNT